MNNEPQIIWKELLATLLRRRSIIIGITVTGIVASLLMVLLEAPQYSATAKVIVLEKRTSVAASPDAMTRPVMAKPGEQSVNSEVALLRSPSLVRATLEAFPSANSVDSQDSTLSFSDIVQLPFRLPTMAYRALHGIPAPTALDGKVQHIAANLSVWPIPRSNLIGLSYASQNPQWAAKFVNELLDTHLRLNAERNHSSDTEAFYRRQKILAAQQLATANEALSAFRQKVGADLLSQDETTLRARLAQTELDLTTSKTQLAEQRATVGFLSKEMSGPAGISATAGAAGQTAAMIQQRIVDLELQKTQLLGRYAPTSTVIADLDRQIADMRKLLNPRTAGGSAASLVPVQGTVALNLVQAQTQKAGLQARVDELETQMSKYRTQLEKLDAVSAQRAQIEEDVTSATNAYTTYVGKLEEVRFSNALDASHILNLAVVEPAEVPSSPVPSAGFLQILLGAFLSLAAGLAVAFLVDRLDPTVKSATQAARATGIPVIGEIPS